MSESSYKRQKRKPENSASQLPRKQFKDAGHQEVNISEFITERFEVIRILGDGTFGRVVEVRDNRDKINKAIKIIRPVSRYVEAAKIEASILRQINGRGSDEFHIARFYEDFAYKSSYCLVFEVYGISLYDFLKKNRFRGFQITQVQSFTKQLLQAINFLHQNQLTHTDLKLENILLVKSEYDSIPITQKKSKEELKEESSNKGGDLQSRSTSDESLQPNFYFKPRFTDIKIIDFGGATYARDYHTSIINTRQYRGPEVILENGWGMASDIWSAGCILYELYTGELLFPTHDSYEHLAMMHKRFGQFPLKMVKRCCKACRKYWDSNYKFNWPKYTTSKQQIDNVNEVPMLEEVIQHKEFLDLIKKMLTYDPSIRISARQALLHPFLSTWYGDLL